MLDVMLRAQLPAISVTTDDTVNLPLVLQSIAKSLGLTVKVMHWDGASKPGPHLYYTFQQEHVTAEMYAAWMNADRQLIVVNPLKPNPLIVDAGILATPPELVHQLLKEHAPADMVPALLQSVKGMSLKAIMELLRITAAQTGSVKPADVRRVRSSLAPAHQGMYQVDTSFDFYSWPQELKSWLETNAKYFAEGVHHKLVPRGILLPGPPGVGKSMAAKAIANRLGVPLFRLDVASALDRFVGVSEARIGKILRAVEQEAPCVLLIDELEKIFETDGEAGTLQRILSQILWWLSEHRSLVFTVATTNDRSKIPPELYRPGRMDMVLDIPLLSVSEAKVFAQKEFASIVGKAPAMAQSKILGDALENLGLQIAHSRVSVLVQTEIKRNGWM